MYKILLNAQKKNNQLKKQAYKTNDPNYIDVNNMTVDWSELKLLN